MSKTIIFFDNIGDGELLTGKLNAERLRCDFGELSQTIKIAKTNKLISSSFFFYFFGVQYLTKSVNAYLSNIDYSELNEHQKDEFIRAIRRI